MSKKILNGVSPTEGNVVPTSMTWAADLPSAGALVNWYANFAPGTGSPEALLCSSSSNGVKQRVFWLNENLVPRIAASKPSEVPLKIHGYNGGGQTANLIEFKTQWAGGTVLYAIDANGKPRLGDSGVLGAHVIVLATGAAIPTGTPSGTVIVRT